MEKDELEEESKLFKVLKFILGLFLILLMLSFLIPNDAVQSLVEQRQINNNKIEAGQLTVLFENNVYENLKDTYLKNQLTELSLCLRGKIINLTYSISSFYKPKIFFATPISIASSKCDENTIITLHTHPFNNCLFSYQDVISFNSYYDKQLLTVVMCSIDKFAVLSNQLPVKFS